jgi:hypothetical protein
VLGEYQSAGTLGVELCPSTTELTHARMPTSVGVGWRLRSRSVCRGAGIARRSPISGAAMGTRADLQRAL